MHVDLKEEDFDTGTVGIRGEEESGAGAGGRGEVTEKSEHATVPFSFPAKEYKRVKSVVDSMQCGSRSCGRPGFSSLSLTLQSLRSLWT